MIPEPLAESIKAIIELHDETANFIDSYSYMPTELSIYSNEAKIFPNIESLKTVASQSSLFIEIAADHLYALTKTLEEPAQTITPWTIARTETEACALGYWLCDPKIDVRARIARSFAFRYEGMIQQLKILRTTEKAGDTGSIEQKIDKVEQDAINFGYDKIMDKKGKRIGIAQKMPSITSLIASTLEQEYFYRLFSAMVHGHTWAIRHLSFRLIDDQGEPTTYVSGQNSSKDYYLEKSISVENAKLLCQFSATNFSILIWRFSFFMGWDIMKLAKTMDRIFTDLEIPHNSAMWTDSGGMAK